jgi:hypothetical protein
VEPKQKDEGGQVEEEASPEAVIEQATAHGSTRVEPKDTPVPTPSSNNVVKERNYELSFPHTPTNCSPPDTAIREESDEEEL